MRILLVEDSVSNRLLIQSYVKKMPCELDLAENGEIAVDMFKAVHKSPEAGCTAYLSKPIKKAALLAAISEHTRSLVT